MQADATFNLCKYAKMDEVQKTGVAELEAAMEILGLKPSQLAKAAGVSTTTVTRPIKAAREGREGLKHAVSARTLYAVRELVKKAAPDVTADPEPNARIAPGAGPFPLLKYPRSVPVFGTAQGGPEGVFDLNMESGAIDYAPRPPSIADNKRVFAIYVEGDSMWPWRDPGELVYLHETKPPTPGCHVVAVVESLDASEPPRAYLKRLVRRSPSKIEMEQYHPPGPFVLDAKRVSKLLRVLEWSEVYAF